MILGFGLTKNDAKCLFMAFDSDTSKNAQNCQNIENWSNGHFLSFSKGLFFSLSLFPKVHCLSTRLSFEQGSFFLSLSPSIGSMFVFSSLSLSEESFLIFVRLYVKTIPQKTRFRSVNCTRNLRTGQNLSKWLQRQEFN